MNSSVIAMALFIAITYLAPIIIKTPTNVKPIDDLVKMSIVQRQYMMTGVILIGIIVYLTDYIKEKHF
jgi:hypothetical protein